MPWLSVSSIDRRTDEAIEKADVTLLSTLIDHLNVQVVHLRPVQIDGGTGNTEIIDGIVLVGDGAFDDLDHAVF